MAGRKCLLWGMEIHLYSSPNYIILVPGDKKERDHLQKS